MRYVLLCTAWLCFSVSVYAQTPAVPIAPTAPAVTAARPLTLNIQSVTCGHRQPSGKRNATTQATDATATSLPCGLGRRLQLSVPNLSAWMQADPKNDPSQLRLALNGYALVGIPPTTMVFEHDTLSFDLDHPDDDNHEATALRNAWRAILRKHRARTYLPVSIGLQNTQPFFGAQSALFEFLPPYSAVIFLGAGLGLLLLVWLAIKSDIMRIPGPSPGPGKRLPYDLGRLQMACWMVIVLGSYLYIWLITDDHDSLTPSVLILLGISSATGLSSVLIDSSKQPTDASATTTVEPSPDTAASAPAAAPSAGVRSSEGFLRDILSDTSGISLHRVQMAAWTIVLGIVFLREVFNDLSMPNFSATLLGLLGISAGTYVGFKIPESLQK
jgi:hypothetical protein